MMFILPLTWRFLRTLSKPKAMPLGWDIFGLQPK